MAYEKLERKNNYPADFRQRLHNLKVDAQETIEKILAEWREAQGRPDAEEILIPERSRTHIQPIISLGPDACITIYSLNAHGVRDEDDNFFPWDDLGHENDIINVAEYLEGIRLHLISPDAQILIENVLNSIWGDTTEERNHNQSVAGQILDVLSKNSKLNPMQGL
jgi:hypothetical protein